MEKQSLSPEGSLPQQHKHDRSLSIDSLSSHMSLKNSLESYDTLYTQLQKDLQSSATGDEFVETRKFKDLIEMQHQLIKKLRFDLDCEHGRVKILRHDNEQLKKMHAEIYQEHEIEEEQITNKLLKNIMGLKREKTEMLTQMEKEEEYITNKLQRKLKELQKEKIDLEIAMEQEQEFIVNRLTKQLDEMKKNRSTTSPYASISSLNAATTGKLSQISRKPSETLFSSPSQQQMQQQPHQVPTQQSNHAQQNQHSVGAGGASSHSVMMRDSNEEIAQLKTQFARMERDHEQKIAKYQTEIERLKSDIKQQQQQQQQQVVVEKKTSQV
ncbi:hypothetical protein MIR68_006159 [Amoeboaphelidium protococcarum]|nr:hypothetical protein MIR68_006159 [Amoeboaphelidium protococcarum]